MNVADPLHSLTTPCLLLDEQRMERNITRLKQRLDAMGVTLRAHLKTAKCVPVARRMMLRPDGPATVSTLKEAEEFAAAGVRDILYAVGISTNKLDRVLALRRAGVDLSVILDSIEQARAVAAKSKDAGGPIPALIEIDSDGHRAGVRASDPLLMQIAQELRRGGAELRGVIAHAGSSYDSRSTVDIVHTAQTERDAAVRGAAALRAEGLPCPTVSVGSTPTAHFARDLAGVTEVRAGVYVFFDLVMAGIGVCTRDDIALSVLTTVTGHDRRTGRLIVDAGWMALSRDQGTASQPVDHSYGLVCDLQGRIYDDLLVKYTNQEHGVLEMRTGSSMSRPPLEVGSLVRILPIHACATAAQHGHYHVVNEGRVTDRWERIAPGW